MHLNDCLETGLQLRNLTWDVLIRPSFKPILICGPTKATLLQIKIKEAFVDVPQIHWYGKVFKALEKNMYADDLGTGGSDVNYSVELFQKGGFNLHNNPN